jgi:metal-responsive CopG/Arc/MetJ family transcriptional regulator
MGRKRKTDGFIKVIEELDTNKNENRKTISITLPESLIADLDNIAEQLGQSNRSFVCEKGLGAFVEECKTYIKNKNKKL